MTMIELLVGTIIAFIVITPLMGMVLGMLNDDQRESAKANTEEELNSALQYMSEDMSQAIHIYDNTGVNTLASAANSILPNPPVSLSPAPLNSTPILVFLKRKLVENALPPGNTTTVGTCNPALDPDDSKNANCDDAFVLSLVAYYLVTPSKPTNTNSDPFCNDGGTCPARIYRFELQDGVKNISQSYVCGETGLTACNDNSQKRSVGFPKVIDASSIATLNTLIREPGESINLATNPSQVLVNYIDISTANIPAAATCNVVLGVTTQPKLTERNFADAAAANLAMLRKTDSNSFYACVDSTANVAQIYLRGNALRRMQKDAPYSPNKTVFFPTATMQVRGLGTFGSQ
jgi:type II secretory pathway pseudopilin PulG